MITNNQGGFFIPQIHSRFQGFFVRLGNQTFKVLDEVSSSAKLKFQMHNDSLIVSASKTSKIDLFFDVKEAYDNDTFGKFYELKQEGKDLIIHFKKKKHDKTEYSLYIALPNVKYKEVNGKNRE